MRTDLELRNDELEAALKSDDENAIKAQLIRLEQALVNLAVPWHVLDRLREATLRTQRSMEAGMYSTASGRKRKKQKVEQKVDPKEEHPGDVDEDA